MWTENGTCLENLDLAHWKLEALGFRRECCIHMHSTSTEYGTINQGLRCPRIKKSAPNLEEYFMILEKDPRIFNASSHGLKRYVSNVSLSKLSS